MKSSLTILFENPFWIGLYERIDGDKYAQQAIKLQHEQTKIERKTKSREQKEAEKERQFVLRQEKKKAKHRGR